MFCMIESINLVQKLQLMRHVVMLVVFLNLGTAHAVERLDGVQLLSEYQPLQALSRGGDQWRQYSIPPKSVSVLPVFAVATDQSPPKQDQVLRFKRHLEVSRARFQEMTRGLDTFQIRDGYVVINLKNPLSFYKTQIEDGAPAILSEILDSLKVSRFAAPWVFAVAVINDKDGYPTPGGRPINGGLNNGGGYLHFSSGSLNPSDTRLQSTLEHELGHAFGLLHVDSYGEDMNTSQSIMSYNPKHQYGLDGKPNQSGILLARDLYALSRNKKVFPKLAFGRFAPQSIRSYEPMTIPNHPDALIKAETQSGETWGSKVQNIFVGRLTASVAPCCSYDGGSMWHSARTSNREVSLVVSLPITTPVDRLIVYTQHSGSYHMARRIEIAFYNNEKLVHTLEEDVWYPDKELSFFALNANRLEFKFTTEDSVVVRGLRFFFEGNEITFGSQKYLH